MATIDTSYFSGDMVVAQKSDAAVASSIQWFIDEYEPKLLNDLLGYSLSKSYTDGIAAGSPDAKWLAIRDGKEYTNRSSILSKWNGLKFTQGSAKKSLIANYIYFYYMQDQASITTGTGEKQVALQNAINISTGNKMVRAWNEMVTMNWQLKEFLLSNQGDYPDFQEYFARHLPNYLFHKINMLGI